MALVMSGLILLALGLASLKLVAGGAFFYSLDDPYIHLALARQIQHGGYGINPGEWAAPSSSIVWPFLLALVPPPLMEWAPLVINVLACLASVAVLRAALRGSGLPDWLQALGAVAMAFGMNFFGLVFTGMEHSLQVLLVCLLARQVATGQQGLALWWPLGLLPLVRYECLAITLPVATWLLWQGRGHGGGHNRGHTWPRVLGVMALSLGTIAAFSFFLHAKLGAWLPSSVLAKSAGSFFTENYKTHPILLAGMGLLFWLWRARLGQWLLCVVAPVAGFMVGGRTGWFGRYEVFILAWVAVLLLHAVGALWRQRAETAPQGRRDAALASLALVGVLSLGFPTLLSINLYSPMASRTISEQQAVMARLTARLGEPVAVNDLGLVALRGGQRVLDLWGLGSHEALLLRRQSNRPEHEWMAELMQRQQVQQAFIFENWFPDHPQGWTKVGTLVLKSKRMVVPESEVALFSTNEAAAARLRQALGELAQQDPALRPMIRLN